MTTVIASEWPVARKEHRCELCNRIIEAGERYNRQRNIGDDGPYVFKACEHCLAMVKALDEESAYWYDDCFGYTADDLWEYDPASIHTARLKVMHRRQWRRRDGALYPVPHVLPPGGWQVRHVESGAVVSCQDRDEAEAHVRESVSGPWVAEQVLPLGGSGA